MAVAMRLLSVAAILLGSTSIASAQAWVDAPGQLSLSLRSDYQMANGVWHGSLLVTGLPTKQLNSGISIGYTPIESLAVGLTLDTNGASYTGPQSIPGQPNAILRHGSQDDGSFHWNLTDLTFDAAYQVYDGPVAITPVARFKTPVSDYENLGYAAAGTRLKEGGAGVYFGRYGVGAAERLVLQLGYVFTYVEKYDGGGAETEQYRTNRSDVDFSASYVINEKFIAGAGAAYRHTHDGFDLEEYPMLDGDSPLILHHDPVLKARYLAIAAVASYQVTRQFGVAGRLAKVVTGQNVSDPLSFGLTLSFGHNFAE